MVIDLSVRLRQLRLDKRLRQDQVARLIGVSKGAVSAYENDIRQPSYVHDSYATDASGAVQSSGNLKLTDCTITANTSWANAGVMSIGGTLTISNCQIQDNTVLSPDNGIAVDIFSQDSIWSITENEHEGAGYYDVVTGNKIALPVVESTEAAKLIYLTDEEAEDYFAPPMSSDGDDTLPGDGDDNLNPPAPGDDSTIPDGDGDGEDTVPDEEPNTPEEGEDEDGESSQQPEDTIPPTDTDNDEEASDGDLDGTEQPEKPVEDDSDSGEDYIPTKPHKPVQRPSEPETDIQEPTQEPEENPAPSLICGEAVINTSRSVVLAGYGDGQLHEGDFLTRAQLATIIYRLLDDESITLFGAGQAVFDDVSDGAWYYQAVTTIGHAGIVNGVGDNVYDPDGLVTWAQVLAVLSRFVEPQEWPLQYIQYNGWARQAVETAVALGWIEDSAEVAPNSMITRGEVVDLINTVLEQYR